MKMYSKIKGVMCLMLIVNSIYSQVLVADINQSNSSSDPNFLFSNGEKLVFNAKKSEIFLLNEQEFNTILDLNDDAVRVGIDKTIEKSKVIGNTSSIPTTWPEVLFNI